MFTIRQYLATLSDPHGVTRTLGDCTLSRNERGEPLYWVGNSAIIFRIHRAERSYALRCYLRPMRHLREIYGDRWLEKELYLYTSTDGSGEWVDVVMDEWIEGVNFRTAIDHAARSQDGQLLADYATKFDRLAAELLADGCAHGDLKPENILATADGELHLIDWDGSYMPAFDGETSPELGTAAYQHPARQQTDFGAYLDDFSAALISTALHALAIDPTLYLRYSNADGLLLTPQLIPHDAAYCEVLSLFEMQGMALCYRIALTLAAQTPHLFGIAVLFAQTTQPTASSATQTPELFVENGHWGYRTADKIVISPLYDEGFDFTEGVAAVRLNHTWHFIDSGGRLRIRGLAVDAVKPFRNGEAAVICGAERYFINHKGERI